MAAGVVAATRVGLVAVMAVVVTGTTRGAMVCCVVLCVRVLCGVCVCCVCLCVCVCVATEQNER